MCSSNSFKHLFSFDPNFNRISHFGKFHRTPSRNLEPTATTSLQPFCRLTSDLLYLFNTCVKYNKSLLWILVWDGFLWTKHQPRLIYSTQIIPGGRFLISCQLPVDQSVTTLVVRHSMSQSGNRFDIRCSMFMNITSLIYAVININNVLICSPKIWNRSCERVLTNIKLSPQPVIWHRFIVM